MVYLVSHYINGQKVSVKKEEKLPIYNPSTGEYVGEIGIAHKDTIAAAIDSSSKAFLSWKETPAIKRARILYKFRDLVEIHAKELAHLVSSEHGKTSEDALGSIKRGLEVIEYHCGILSQLQTSFTEVTSEIDTYSLRQPLGICLGISPFNFPIMVPIWMMIPAIATGNSFILKPSEQDPLSTLRLIELLTEAGLPAGVVNCIQGTKETVEILLQTPEIKAVTAVASTPAAEAIYQKASAHGKRVHTFGGAKNHALIMPDADIEQAAFALTGAAFGSAGERCMAISVAISIGKSTHQRLLDAILPKVKAIKIDCSEVENTDMGPLISEAHRQRVLTAIGRGIEEGAHLLVDGRYFKHPTHPEGFYLGPCLFTEVTPSMSVYQEEIFGPVLVMMQVETFEEALNLVNTHPYGNGTAIFTRDGFSARDYAKRVEVGMVGINIPIPVPIVSHPFGGWKRSFFGDIAMHGQESINFYTRLKTMTVRWPKTQVTGSSFVMPTHEGEL